jgi:hypothetical protein
LISQVDEKRERRGQNKGEKNSLHRRSQPPCATCTANARSLRPRLSFDASLTFSHSIRCHHSGTELASPFGRFTGSLEVAVLHTHLLVSVNPGRSSLALPSRSPIDLSPLQSNHPPSTSTHVRVVPFCILHPPAYLHTIPLRFPLNFPLYDALLECTNAYLLLALSLLPAIIPTPPSKR